MTDDFGTASEIERAFQQPVALVDYDPAWPLRFEAEKRRLLDALPGVFLGIEHIGSTAVPGMRAKPLIDLLAGVASMDEAIALNDTVGVCGYTTAAGINATLKTRQWFMRQQDGHRTHHLHVVVYGTDEWDIRIRFRDRLRVDMALRDAYIALKEELADRYAGDRESYTEGKSDFIMAASQA